MEIEIDRKTGIPLYLQIKEEMGKDIRRRSLKIGDQLPTEKELQQKFSVSRATVRQALSELEQEGIIERRQGIGTFLSFPRFSRKLANLAGFSEQMIAEGCKPGSQLLSSNQVDDEMICNQFGPPSKNILKVTRLRLVDNEPIGIHYTYLPKRLADEVNFPDRALKPDENESLYLKFKQNGYNITRALQTITAKKADEFESTYLNVKEGEPLLFIHKKSFTNENKLLEIVEAVYRSDKYEYSIHLQEKSVTGQEISKIKND